MSKLQWMLFFIMIMSSIMILAMFWFQIELGVRISIGFMLSSFSGFIVLEVRR